MFLNGGIASGNDSGKEGAEEQNEDGDREQDREEDTEEDREETANRDGVDMGSAPTEVHDVDGQVVDVKKRLVSMLTHAQSTRSPRGDTDALCK